MHQCFKAGNFKRLEAAFLGCSGPDCVGPEPDRNVLEHRGLPDHSY